MAEYIKFFIVSQEIFFYTGVVKSGHSLQHFFQDREIFFHDSLLEFV